MRCRGVLWGCQRGFRPAIAIRALFPDEDCLVLGAGDDGVLLGGRVAARGPGDVADPVGVALEGGLKRPLPGGLVEAPHLGQVVTATSDKALRNRATVTGAGDQGGQVVRGGRRAPRHGIAPDLVGREDLRLPAPRVHRVGEDGDLAVARGAGEHEAELMWRPGDRVDGGLVDLVLLHLDPL